MQYCVTHPEEVSQLAKLQAQVEEVKETMIGNIEKVRIISEINGWFAFLSRIQ